MAGPRRGTPPVTFRVLLALVLLAGHYALALVILAALAGTDLFLAGSPRAFSVVSLEAYLASAAIAYSVVRVVFLTRGDGREPLVGLPVTADEQPGLWRRVEDLAEQVGTRPPVEIRLITEVNAMVSQDVRLLGLLPGPRRLFVGVPLLIGLSEPEVDAVLAHELGHYANADVRFAGLVWAGRRALLRTVDTLGGRADAYRAKEEAESARRTARARTRGKPAPRSEPRGPDHYLAKIFAGYATMGLRATESVSRRQEYAANLVAARIAGRDNTASALRRLPALDAAQQVYLHRYAMMGWEAGLLPPPGQVYGGLSLLLADPTRRRELAVLERNVPRTEQSPYDSHPPVADAVAAVEALPDDGRGPRAPRRPALALLRDPDATLATLERATLSAEAASKRRVDWAELPGEARRATCAAAARPLLDAMAETATSRGLVVGERTALLELLDLIDSGLLRDIANRMPASEVASRSTGRAAAEFARAAFGSALGQLALLTLLDAGRISWQLSWAAGAGPALRHAPEGLTEALSTALEAVAADPPWTGSLRALLSAPWPDADPAASALPWTFPNRPFDPEPGY